MGSTHLARLSTMSSLHGLHELTDENEVSAWRRSKFSESQTKKQVFLYFSEVHPKYLPSAIGESS